MTTAEGQSSETLPQRYAELKKRAAVLRSWRKGLTIIGLIAVFFALIIGLSIFLLSGTYYAVPSLQCWLAVLALILTASVLLGTAGALPVGITDYQIQEIEDENELQQMPQASHEQKAFKLLRIQQSQLTQFVRLILRQSSMIAFVGVFAMLVGVGVVLFAIWQAKSAGINDPTEKWVVGLLGAVGAILTNVVSAIYLKMFGDIGAAVKEAMTVLAKSTNVNLANVLVSKIDDPEKTLRNNAYKELATNIASKT